MSLLKAAAASSSGDQRQRVVFQRGLSPFAMLASIETCLQAHFKSARQWYLAMDVERRGYITPDDFLHGLHRFNVHPHVGDSAELAALLHHFPTQTPAQMTFSEFAMFLHQFVGVGTATSSLLRRGDVSSQKMGNAGTDEQSVVSLVRFGLLRVSANLREAFLLIDNADRKGCISFAHLQDRLVQLGLPPEAVRSTHFEAALNRLSVCCANHLKYHEFVALLTHDSVDDSVVSPAQSHSDR